MRLARPLILLVLAGWPLSFAYPHTAPFPHTHPWQGEVRSPRERIHGYIGVGGHAVRGLSSDLDGKAPAPRWGGGGGFVGGVRFGPVVGLDIGYAAAGLDTEGPTLRLQSFQLGIQLHVPTSLRVDPYLRLALGGATLSDALGTLAVGDIFSAGLGVDIWLRRHWTVGGRVLYHVFIFGEDEREGGFSLVGIEASTAVHF